MSSLPRQDWKASQVMWDAVAALGEGKRCYQLSDRTVAMLLSQTIYLHWHTRWLRDTPFSDAEKKQIRDWASQAETELMKDSDCVECDDDDCIVYPLNASRIEWLPADPFTEPNYVPPTYQSPPWYIASAGNPAGASPGDVTTDIAHIPLGGALPPYDRFPRFRLTVQGAVRVQIYLVTLVLGGIALIQVDGDLGLLSYFDLNADTLSIPSEPSGGEVIWEHEFNVDGEHFIDLTMIPWIDDSSTPIRFGGAVRKIVICGDQSLELCPDCPEPEPCEDCEECEDCEDWIEDEIGIDLEDLEMLLDCYKHSVGDIKMNAGTTVSGGWLLCDGSSHPKLQYPELAAMLEGVTESDELEFAVPDFSLRSPMGVGEGLDALAAAGESTHTLTAAEMPEHSHTFGSHVHEVGAHTHPIPDHSHTVSPATHAHISAAVIIPTKGNGEIGSGTRLLRGSNSVGSDTTLTVEPAATAISSSFATTSTNIVPQANTPFNTSAASGGSASAGGGEAHNNVHPVLGVHFFIFAGCAISAEDCP